MAVKMYSKQKHISSELWVYILFAIVSFPIIIISAINSFHSIESIVFRITVWIIYLLFCAVNILFFALMFAEPIGIQSAVHISYARRKAIVKRFRLIWFVSGPILIYIGYYLYQLSWPYAGKIVVFLISMSVVTGILRQIVNIETDINLICPSCGSFKIERKTIDGSKQQSKWDERVRCIKCSTTWIVNVEEIYINT
jgi:hypothetical protein